MWFVGVGEKGCVRFIRIEGDVLGVLGVLSERDEESTLRIDFFTWDVNRRKSEELNLQCSYHNCVDI